MTVPEILSALREEVTEDGHVLLDRLEGELAISFWPEEVWNAALGWFGPSLNNRQGRTYMALDRRIRHALRIWQERYGPWTQEQREYAHTVLARAIDAGGREANGSKGQLYAFVQQRIGQAVNHEVIDAGFKRRAAPLIDVREHLAALAS